MPSNERMTQMERQAVIDARRQFTEAIKAMGVDNQFMGWSAEHVDYLIWNIWVGVRASMMHQSNSGDVPF